MSEEKKSHLPKEEEASVTLSKKEHEGLLKQLAELEALKDRYMRSAADFDNAKKRLAREREEFIRYSQEELIREMLLVVDNLERALAHAGEVKDEAAKRIITGVELVLKHLQEVLKSRGLKRLQTVGQQFDPHLHEAVAYVEEKGKEDQVIDEVSPGYMLHDRLLRAPKVRVRVAPGSKDTQEKEEELT